MIRRIVRILRARGVAGLAHAARTHLAGLMAGQAKSFRSSAALFEGKRGIEIGGPSKVFTAGGCFPVYPIAGNIDNCNFGDVTVWQGAVNVGRSFRFDPGRPAGMQFIAEATDMSGVVSATYDFVLASHVLEHVANPLCALKEWRRLLVADGTLVLILPDKEKTFDHRRPVTKLDHLIADYQVETGEDDLTHLEEILALHDLVRDPEAGSADEFRQRSLENIHNRCLHHHVFDAALVEEMIDYMNFEKIVVERIAPFHILVLVSACGNQTDPHY